MNAGGPEVIARVRRKLRHGGVRGLLSEALDRTGLGRPQRYRRDPPSPNGFERIYHLHIRKCGGTSVNKMFLAAFTEDADAAYMQLVRAPRHHALVGGVPFVGWNPRLINRGAFFFAFSHQPFHALDLDESTYTFALIRDPVQRVLSHYKMTLSLVRDGGTHPNLEEEGAWLGNGFADFVERIPRQHLCNQLYMFSREFSIPEALRNAARITNLRPLSQLDRLVDDLNREFGLTLRPMHTRRAEIGFEPTPAERRALLDRMSEEIDFYEELRGRIAPSD